MRIIVDLWRGREIYQGRAGWIVGPQTLRATTAELAPRSRARDLSWEVWNL